MAAKLKADPLKASPSPAPSQGEYEVVSTPDKPLAFTNHVYLSPGTYEKLRAAIKKKAPVEQDTYVRIDEFVFTARPHDKILDNQIALGLKQKQTLQTGDGNLVRINAFLLPKNGSYNLTVIKFDLVPHASTKKIKIKESDLHDFLRENYAQQIFTKNQSLVVNMDGNVLLITVREMDAFVPVDDNVDGGNKNDVDETVTHQVDQGIFLNLTEIEIKAENTKLFILEPANNRTKSFFRPDWKFEDMGIGGLDNEFSQIFRRAFASRVFPPTLISQLGIQHVKGMLLYGPPGTGKTLIARQIGKMLGGKIEPLVVNGPEILNKFVGASEENIRKLFQPAEEDYALNKDNADLHIIIFDEIDAICKARGSTSGGTGVQDTVVNQLLSKLDGVNPINNILVIGMTNRKDMLDPALLRPGRLEVHVPINLPDEKGRVQILHIHTKQMKENGKLAADVDIPLLASKTKNFSPAELVGLVKSAMSYALNACIDTNKGGNGTVGVREASKILITMAHFLAALEEVKPAFGVQEDALKSLIQGPLYDYGLEFQKLMKTMHTLVQQVQNSNQTRLMSIILEGPAGAGKTSIAAQVGLDSNFPFIKVISPEMYLGMSEAGKCSEIAKTFEDAYKSPLSLIILDGIEILLDYVPIGPRFSNQVLQTIKVLVSRIPPEPKHKLMIIGTTSDQEVLDQMQLKSFNVVLDVPQLTKPSQIKKVFELCEAPVDSSELALLAADCPLPISIKSLLLVIEMAKQETGIITAEGFAECFRNAGLHR